MSLPACTCQSQGGQCDSCAEAQDEFEKILNEPCPDLGEEQSCHYYGIDVIRCELVEECPRVEAWLKREAALKDDSVHRNEEY